MRLAKMTILVGALVTLLALAIASANPSIDRYGEEFLNRPHLELRLQNDTRFENMFKPSRHKHAPVPDVSVFVPIYPGSVMDAALFRSDRGGTPFVGGPFESSFQSAHADFKVASSASSVQSWFKWVMTSGGWVNLDKKTGIIHTTGRPAAEYQVEEFSPSKGSRLVVMISSEKVSRGSDLYVFAAYTNPDSVTLNPGGGTQVKLGPTHS